DRAAMVHSVRGVEGVPVYGVDFRLPRHAGPGRARAARGLQSVTLRVFVRYGIRVDRGSFRSPDSRWCLGATLLTRAWTTRLLPGARAFAAHGTRVRTTISRRERARGGRLRLSSRRVFEMV